MKIEDIARVCHEANRAYCVTIGDNSQPPWDEAPEWQRSSVIAGVANHNDNRNFNPRLSHESWMERKSNEGWIYGPEKDPERKKHPNMVEWEYLPAEQRAKDVLFCGICMSLLPMLKDDE